MAPDPVNPAVNEPLPRSTNEPGATMPFPLSKVIRDPCGKELQLSTEKVSTLPLHRFSMSPDTCGSGMDWVVTTSVCEAKTFPFWSKTFKVTL